VCIHGYSFLTYSWVMTLSLPNCYFSYSPDLVLLFATHTSSHKVPCTQNKIKQKPQFITSIQVMIHTNQTCSKIYKIIIISVHKKNKTRCISWFYGLWKRVLFYFLYQVLDNDTKYVEWVHGPEVGGHIGDVVEVSNGGRSSTKEKVLNLTHVSIEAYVLAAIMGKLLLLGKGFGKESKSCFFHFGYSVTRNAVVDHVEETVLLTSFHNEFCHHWSFFG